MVGMIKWIKRTTWDRLRKLIRWILVAVITGGILGVIGAAFAKSINWVTAFRGEHPWVLYGMPIAGLLIVLLYRIEHKEAKSSTNLILKAIQTKTRIPLRTAPLIFISTVLTHLVGGSVGREGAALQIGGSIGNFIGKIFHRDEDDTHVLIMCGMSAAFAALFGTPMAAAVFSMEVVSVGVMHYAALVPCVIAALVAFMVSSGLGVSAEAFAIGQIPAFSLGMAGKVLVLGLLCAAVSILFCVVIHKTEEGMKKYFPNPYVRIVVAGTVLILLTKLLGTTDYLGAGMHVVEHYIEGEVVIGAFLIKMIFTAITLGGGYKGGEIVPTFFVGAAFGSLMAGVLGIPVGLAVACGMTAVFCGVTNCPITSLLIGFEMFGFEGAPFFLLAVAVSYMESGYFGLYHSQQILYAKDKDTVINRNTKE